MKRRVRTYVSYPLKNTSNVCLIPTFEVNNATSIILFTIPKAIRIIHYVRAQPDLPHKLHLHD
jgi:hypothetical protein